MFAYFSKRDRGLSAIGVLLVLAIVAAVAIDVWPLQQLEQQAKQSEKTLFSFKQEFSENGIRHQETLDDLSRFVDRITSKGRFADANDYASANEDLAVVQAARFLKSQIGRNQYNQIDQSLADFSFALEDHFKSSISYWKAVKFSFTALAIAGLLVLLILLQRKVSQTQVKLANESRLKDQMLHGIKEGFFILKRDLQIGQLQSSATRHIFNQSKPISGNFLELIQPMLSKQRLKEVKEYLSVLLNQLDRKAIPATLNPLRRLEFVMPNGATLVSRKYLNFEFRRNRVGDEIDLLVSVRDVTKIVDLTRELKLSKEDKQMSFEQMVDKLSPQDSELDTFYEAASGTLREVNSMLNSESLLVDNQLDRLQSIQNKVVKIEHSAAAIGLNLIQSSAQQLDQQIKEIKSSGKVDAKHVLNLLTPLQQMIADVEFTHKLGAKPLGNSDGVFPSRLQLLNSPPESKPLASPEPAPALTGAAGKNKLVLLVHELSKRENKLARLEVRGLYEIAIAESVQKKLEQIVIQLLRNALVYSIESPSVRHRLNKPSKGQLTINIKQRDANNMAVVVRDDGAGLNFKNIKNKAIEAGIVSTTLADLMTENQIVACLFHSKFATHNADGRDTDNAYGLHLARKQVEELGGKISVKSQSGLFSQISVTLPKSLFGKVAA